MLVCEYQIVYIIITNIQSMLEPVEVLDNPQEISFESPGTPGFSSVQPQFQEIDFSFRLDVESDDQIIKHSTYNNDFSFQDPEILENMPSENHKNEGSGSQVNKKQLSLNDVDDMFERIKNTSFIMVNHIERSDKSRNFFQSFLLPLENEKIEQTGQSASKYIENPAIKRDRFNMIFLETQAVQSILEERSMRRQMWFNEQHEPAAEMKTSLSFILKNEIEQEAILTKNAIQSYLKEKDDQNYEPLQINNKFPVNTIKNVQIQANSHQDLQTDLSKQVSKNQIEEPAQIKGNVSFDGNTDQTVNLKHWILSLRQNKPQNECQKLHLPQDDKQNEPQDISQQRSELATIPQENSTNINQSDVQQHVVNVTTLEQTFINSSISEEMTENGQKQINKVVEKPPQIEQNAQPFWQVKIFEQNIEDKRKRRRPCQYWIGENIRYLKNNQVKTSYRKEFQDVFLKLIHPFEIEGNATLFARNNLMKGSLTMKSRSKISVHSVVGILTFKSFKRKVYFTFSQQEVLISNSKGQNKLQLLNPKINSIRNSLQQHCKIIVTIQRIL